MKAFIYFISQLALCGSPDKAANTATASAAMATGWYRMEGGEGMKVGTPMSTILRFICHIGESSVWEAVL